MQGKLLYRIIPFSVSKTFTKKKSTDTNKQCMQLLIWQWKSPAVTSYIVSSPCKRLFPALILRRLKAFKIKFKIQLNNAAVSALNHNSVTFASLSSIYATQFGNQKRNLEAKNSQICGGEKHARLQFHQNKLSEISILWVSVIAISNKSLLILRPAQPMM